MIHVLFVCLGNICRSPMAEAVFRHLVEEAGLSGEISVDSAGTYGGHAGEPPHRGTRDILTRFGVNHAGLRSRKIVADDFTRFDYIVCMDEANVADLRRMTPQGKRVTRLLDYAPSTRETDIEDPYYTGRFEHVYRLVDSGCRGLLAHICEQHGLSARKPSG